MLAVIGIASHGDWPGVLHVPAASNAPAGGETSANRPLLEHERDRLEGLAYERNGVPCRSWQTTLQQVRKTSAATWPASCNDELGAPLTAAKLDVARLKPS